MKKTISVCAFLILILSACSVFGVHFKVHNPKRAGKYPELTEERILKGDQESKFRTCYDVKYYLLNVSFGQDLKKEKGISGSTIIRADVVREFDTLQIDLAEGMTIDQITITENGGRGNRNTFGNALVTQTSYTRKKSAVFVRMPHRMKAGQRFSLNVNFSGEPKEAKRAPWSGGFVRETDDEKKPWWGVACETEGASSWWPCKDVVNDEPDSADLCFTAPEDLTVVSNGRLLRQQEMEGHRMRWEWHVSNPINLYNITFYIGNFRLLQDKYYSGITHDTLDLNHYVLAQHYEKAKAHFGQLKDHLKFYEETFGPYAFYRDGFKLVESPYAGMEHQSAIAYGNGFRNDRLYNFDYIILHETAHEWWGNAVTANDLADGWLHEGFATYCEALYVEKKFGQDASLDYLLNNRLFILNRRPVVAPYGMRYFNYKDSDIYNKGAWVLHSLRYVMSNDSLFFEVLRAFYAQYSYKNAGSADFEKLVNEKTGSDYKWFFDQYLRNRFAPELEYCIKDGELYYRWNTIHTNNTFRPRSVLVRVNIKDNPPPFSGKIVTINPSGQTMKESIGNENIASIYQDGFLLKVTENKELPKLFRKGQ